MQNDVSLDERLSKLRKAFHDDGLIVQQAPGCTGKDYILKDGRIGMFGIQEDSANCRPKRVYYVEGTPFTMGWLIGSMAEPEVHKMASEYKDDVDLPEDEGALAHCITAIPKSPSPEEESASGSGSVTARRCFRAADGLSTAPGYHGAQPGTLACP
jgi:hypothetical protein